MLDRHRCCCRDAYLCFQELKLSIYRSGDVWTLVWTCHCTTAKTSAAHARARPHTVSRTRKKVFSFGFISPRVRYETKAHTPLCFHVGVSDTDSAELDLLSCKCCKKYQLGWDSAATQTRARIVSVLRLCNFSQRTAFIFKTTKYNFSTFWD